VTDNTGAAIPNATVTVTDTAKGTVVTVQSNDSGAYSVEHLIPDTYDIKVSLAGFQNYEAKGIQHWIEPVDAFMHCANHLDG